MTAAGKPDHVAILVHRHGWFEGSNYWLRAIAESWAESNIRISVVNNPKLAVEADLAVLHVNPTVVPAEYLASARRFPVTVNSGVHDISKRVISANLLARGDRYDGPVIVKTDRNYGGYAERQLARRAVGSFRKGEGTAGDVLRWIGEEYRRVRRWWRHGSARAFFDYPVFDSMAKVPDAVWGDSDYIVERFLPERRNGRYCVRTWLFFGDCERHAIFYADEPIIKSDNVVGFERLPEVPEELRQMRRDLKFDFGKFDYAMVDGRPVLFDANRTPSFGNTAREVYAPIARALAGGIASFIPR